MSHLKSPNLRSFIINDVFSKTLRKVDELSVSVDDNSLSKIIDVHLVFATKSKNECKNTTFSLLLDSTIELQINTMIHNLNLSFDKNKNSEVSVKIYNGNDIYYEKVLMSFNLI